MADLPEGLVKLSDLMKDPDLLAPPQAVAPRLAFKGRVVLLAAREKMGKSTLVSAAAAAVSSGTPFLGEPTGAGNVLLYWLEEHHGELARNIANFGGDDERIYIRSQLRNSKNPLKDIEDDIAAIQPELVVIDSLSVLAVDRVEDTWNAGEWVSLLMPIVIMAREGLGVILLHHSRKSDGAYRDSSGIGGAVDMIMEMHKDGSDPRRRKIKTSGRFPLEDFTVRLNDAGSAYEIVTEDGEDLRPYIVLHLFQNPGETVRGLRGAIKARGKDVDSALAQLKEMGIVQDQGSVSRSDLTLHPKMVSYLEDTPTVSRSRVYIMSWDTLDEKACPGSKYIGGTRDTLQETVHERVPPPDTPDTPPLVENDSQREDVENFSGHVYIPADVVHKPLTEWD